MKKPPQMWKMHEWHTAPSWTSYRLGLDDPLVSEECFSWLELKRVHYICWKLDICCICSDWKRGLADCSVVWRRKSWRSSTKERRRRWYIFSFTPVLVLFLSDQSIPCYLCVICLCVCVCGNPSGAAGVPSVPLAACARGSWGTVYWRLPPPAAVLDARMVR